MKNLVKAKLDAGERVLGTFFHSGSEVLAECLGYAGLDYFIIDTEHGPMDAQSSVNVIRAAKLAGCTPFARVADSSRAHILKMLEAGAMGIIIPNVRSADEVREIVRHGKYYPRGERGIATTPGNQYWTQPWAFGIDNYLGTSNNETMLIPQCETRECLEAIEEVAAIDGVDGIFVGPADLSAALGRPGDFSNPEFNEAIDRILAACKAAGKPAFIWSGNEEDTQRRFEQGFNSVTYALEAVVMMNAFRELVQRMGTGVN